MTASASMPPTPQPSTPMPLTMVVCESVPTSVSGRATFAPPSSRSWTTPRVGEGDLRAAVLAELDNSCQVLEVHLVHDAHARWHHAKSLECLLRPAQQRIPLMVALEFCDWVFGS